LFSHVFILKKEVVMRKSLLLIAVLGAFSSAQAAMAEEAKPDYTITSNASFVSDYIFRGQSQTWGKPAVQVSTELAHKSGLYAGFFGSNVSGAWLPGTNLETDLYAGFRNTIGATEVGYDVGGIFYVYPGGNWDQSDFNSDLTPASAAWTKANRLNTFEVYGSLSYKWLSFKSGITTTEYWGWNENNSGVNVFNTAAPSAGVKGSTKGSYFYELNASNEIFPTWTVSGQLGRQVINNSTGLDLTYYKAGVSKALPQGWSVAAFYSGTNEPSAYKDFTSLANITSTSDIAKDKVFFSVSKSF
jgi:Bacterial protein of unknown function (Gcw_chp)